MKHIGRAQTSLTNRQLAAGKGVFVSDIQRHDMTHMAVVRSPHASARIVSIDSAAAEAIPGVVKVVTGQEIKANMNPIFEAYDTEAMGAKGVVSYALCPERVRYVGEAVAAVVAEDKYTARKAADLVAVEYETTPIVSNTKAALEPGSPLVEPDWGDNILITRDFVKGDPDKAFADAEMTSSDEVYQHRYTGAALEPRAYMAEYDPYTEQLTYWASTQNPHPVRVFLAETLGIEESSIRVIQPHVGGGFGLKTPTFQEEPLVAYLARSLERPVKFVSERTEDLLVGGHAREMRLSYDVAFTKDGRITGFRAKVVADVGAPSALCGWGMSFVCAYSIPGCYKIENANVKLFSVVTNKCPWNAYRGYGKETASYLMDRVLDDVAAKTGRDRAEVRLKNFIPPDEFPYTQVSGANLDSGNYPGTLKRVLEMIDYEGFPARQEEARREGRYIGLGIGQELTPEGCSMPRSTLLGGYDGATVRVNPSGQVTVLTGITSPGNGNETAIAQIAADSLGVPFDQIKVIQGDTDICPYGLGNYSSRSVIMGGSAVQIAAKDIRDKMLKVAAKMLEVSADEVEVEEGQFSAKGAPARYVLFKDVASTVYRDCHGVAALEVEPGLESTRYFQHGNVYHQPETQGRFSAYPSWPNQSMAMIIEIDPETGHFDILKYCAVHDSGTVVNPLLAEANLHGGFLQGVGGAAHEHLVYDDDCQLLTTTFMDYTCPTAMEVPFFEVEHQETLSPFTPLGTKGVGESGVAGALSGLCSAIENALPHLDLRFTDLPLSPNAVWNAIHEAEEKRT
ncbi:MAG: xanthine dehydrogenase family protein molybdopterin-binding subunit [Alphaproteobacteria bacterium]|jgi:carbon-monoxide dehydrogenase large subunit|nr:xanthine dehydrogenase family protein molybdopterin-binding subunit [Alphaproteobacteria bacterium]